MFRFLKTFTFLVAALSFVGCAKDRMQGTGCCSQSTPNRMLSQSQQVKNQFPPAVESIPVSAEHVVQNKLCPVSGGPIDSMGGRIPVKVNGNTIFVCCEGCVDSVEKNPQKFLRMAQGQM